MVLILELSLKALEFES